MCVSPPLPSSADLLPLLFPFCSVPKAFWQGSDFCAHSSVLKEKGEKQKGCRRRGEGWWRGGSPGARPGPAGARGLVPRGRPCPQDLAPQGLVASFSWESFAHLCSVPLCWLLLEGGLEKQGFFLLLHSLGWEPKRIPTLCSWS